MNTAFPNSMKASYLFPCDGCYWLKQKEGKAAVNSATKCTLRMQWREEPSEWWSGERQELAVEQDAGSTKHSTVKMWLSCCRHELAQMETGWPQLLLWSSQSTTVIKIYLSDAQILSSTWTTATARSQKIPLKPFDGFIIHSIKGTIEKENLQLKHWCDTGAND